MAESKNSDLAAIITQNEAPSKRNFSPIINSSSLNSVTPTVNTSALNDYKNLTLGKPS